MVCFHVFGYASAMYHLRSYWVLVCLLRVYVVIEHMVNSKWFQISTSWAKNHKHTLAPICWVFSITYKSNCTGFTGLPISVGQNEQLILKSVPWKWQPVTSDGLNQVPLREDAQSHVKPLNSPQLIDAAKSTVILCPKCSGTTHGNPFRFT